MECQFVRSYDMGTIYTCITCNTNFDRDPTLFICECGSTYCEYCEKLCDKCGKIRKNINTN